jgi:iron complex outermembrane receptor protein
VAGYEYFKTDYAGGSITALGFKTNLNQATRTSIPYTSTFQNAQTQNPYSAFANPSAELQSYFGRATLNFDDKIIVTGSLRADGIQQIW